jgi:hypothetical protein
MECVKTELSTWIATYLQDKQISMTTIPTVFGVKLVSNPLAVFLALW